MHLGHSIKNSKRSHHPMLNHIHQWRRPLQFPLKTLSVTPLSSLIFTKPSVSTATSSAADMEPTTLDDPAAVHKSKDLYSSLCFKILVERLNSVQVERIIGDLGVEYPEFSTELFYLLKNEYGFRHSRVCYFVIAHVLAGERRLKELRSFLQEMVEEEDATFFFSSFPVFPRPALQQLRLLQRSTVLEELLLQQCI